MYLFDTTHCIRFMFGDFSLKLKHGTQIATCLVVQGELMYGVHKSELFFENLHKVERFLADIKVYGLNNETANTYGKIKAMILSLFGPKDKSKRRNITTESLGFKENDLWIAATAIQHKLILVSADSDMLRLDGIEGLKVENW